MNWLPIAVIPTANAFPVILGGCLIVAIRLARKGTASLPVAWGTIGVLYIVGGGVFDMVATIVHTPTLRDEANLIGRALLDSGHTVAFVYAYAIASQALFLALISTLWLALLRHRDVLSSSLADCSSFLQLLKGATGGARLSWRQWLIPLRVSELPQAYHLMWSLVAILVAGMIDRWYLGLEWFDLVPSMRWLVVGMAFCFGLSEYLGWLYLALRSQRNPIGQPVESDQSVARLQEQ